MFNRNLFKPREGLFLLVGLVLFCIPILASYNDATRLDIIKQQGVLKVATRLSPSTYFIADEKPSGFEYELAKLYATYLGVELQVDVVSELDQLYESLRLNNAHIAAAGLTQTDARNQRFDFSPPYLNSQTHVVYLSKKGRKVPKSYAELDSGSLQVVANSSHAELLRNLDPDLPVWVADPDVEVLDLMEAVHEGRLEYTLVDSADFASNSAFFPRMKIAFSFSDPQPIAWMLKKGGDGSLKRSLEKFFSIPHIKNEITRLENTYFSNNQHLNLVDNLTFQKHLEQRLEPLRPLFDKAAADTGLSWEFIAAISYQESHWNPNAVSPTGVRGLMMLTRRTAKEMGVTKRTDPEQSIMGGAHYFLKQRKRIPERIQEPDRTWFALAIYNVGRGHFEDARVLTQRADKDPDKWENVSQYLPLLSQAKWYKTVRHGYARGREPVTYVKNIRRYLDQLTLESRRLAVEEEQAKQQEEEQLQAEAEKSVPEKALEKLPDTL
ncbi:MAG: membrane-bound lytic murein transglycosylase MltF [Motiliproteus sp.]|nr:membrane-bound lytic murein transglycosylase MltF [Motiliproteus sp.]MCW9052518.1 membrane-bound lytic murein transglycosylase MltF [Motiliproteus sp.]